MSITFTGPVPIPSPQSSPLSILITGSSRGIGFNLVKQYADAHPKNLIIATTRDPSGDSSKELQQFAILAKYKNVHIIPIDTNDSHSIKNSVKLVEKLTDHIDVLINNAGTSGENDPLKITADEMIRVFNTNVVGPLLIIQSYIPLLEKSKNAKVVNLSSGLGSNQFAFAFGKPLISYGTSKAALNYITSALKGTFPQITFLTISPGWVDTDMGNASGTAPTKVTDSVQAIRYYIAEKQLKNSGEFLDIMTGQLLPF